MTIQINVVFLHISRSTGVKADRKSRPSRDHTQKIRSTIAAGTQEEHKGHQDKVFVVIILAFFKFSSLLLHTSHLVLNHRLQNTTGHKMCAYSCHNYQKTTVTSYKMMHNKNSNLDFYALLQCFKISCHFEVQKPLSNSCLMNAGWKSFFIVSKKFKRGHI